MKASFPTTAKVRRSHGGAVDTITEAQTTQLGFGQIRVSFRYKTPGGEYGSLDTYFSADSAERLANVIKMAAVSAR